MKKPVNAVQLIALFFFYDPIAQSEQKLKLTITKQPKESIKEACYRVFKKIYAIENLESVQILNNNQWELLL